MKTFLLAGFLLLGSTALAAEISWVKLNLDYRYRDPGTECTNGLASDLLYLGMEIEGGKVIRASLREYAFPTVRPSGPDLLPWELERLEIVHDAKSGYWIKNWTLSPRLAAWFLTGPNLHHCSPASPIASIEPETLPLAFELDGVVEGILVSHSRRHAFTGRRKDAVAFAAEIKLQQRRFSDR